MLEFTLSGYSLRRSSFKLRVARVAAVQNQTTAYADTADDAA